MALVKQNVDLHAEIFNMRSSGTVDNRASPNRSISRFGLRGVAIMIYTNRFKELRRDQEHVMRNKHLGNAYSQMTRQVLK
jgi:hypothetical protein